MGHFFSGVEVGYPALNLARLVCCFFLHCELLNELSSGKEMLEFALKSPSTFHRQKFEYACLFAIYKIFGGIMCLLVNITILIRSETIEDVIKDYVSVLIISRIDDAMATTF
jgi:hypothetical protein